MGLTHVCKITENSCEHVTINDMPNRKISANSKILFCDLCGQYVTYAYGDVKPHHFRHKPSDKNNCPEYTQGSGGYNYKLQFKNLTLPLKISFDGKPHFELGMFPLPNDLLEKCTGTFSIYSGSNQLKYLYERLQNGEVTYFNVGNVPTEKYIIDFSSAPPEVEKYWQKSTDGIDKKGTLFDAETGYKIMPHTAVQVGKEYYLVYKGYRYSRSDIKIYSQSGIIIKENNIDEKWHIYSVKVTQFTSKAVQFFLNYQARLNEKTAQIRPLWPPCIVKSNIIHHQPEKITFFMCGNTDLKLKTYSTDFQSDRELYTYNELVKYYRMFDINSAKKQQLVAIGYTGVLQYIYLWEDNLKEINESLPIVTVTDIHGKELTQNNYMNLPCGEMVRIKAEYDGEAVLSANGCIRKKIFLKAGKTLQLKNIKLGDQLQIFQGCDCIKTITFFKKISAKKLKTVSEYNNIAKVDREVAQQLSKFSGEKIDVPHSFGAIAELIPNYKETLKVLYRFIRQEYMPEKAFNYLKLFLNRKSL